MEAGAYLEIKFKKQNYGSTTHSHFAFTIGPNCHNKITSEKYFIIIIISSNIRLETDPEFRSKLVITPK